jgi:hypothetical protein
MTMLVTAEKFIEAQAIKQQLLNTLELLDLMAVQQTPHLHQKLVSTM